MSVKRVYVSEETQKLLNITIPEIIKKEAEAQGVDVALIEAIIQMESERYPFAFRYEPNLKNREWYVKLLSSRERKDNFSYCSYGLMQILFGIAKSLGYIGDPFSLHRPELSIHYGVKLLKKLLNRYNGNIKDVIAAYNQGSNKKNKDGKYYNQPYVNTVYKYYKSYKEKGGLSLLDEIESDEVKEKLFK